MYHLVISVKQHFLVFPSSQCVVVSVWLQKEKKLAATSSDLYHRNSAKSERLKKEDKDNSIGRRLSDNEEIDEAPESAHVKRTAQEDFDPEAFMLRRSMPWTDGRNEGLYFVAFVADLRAFEVQMLRMSGNEDGIRDAIFEYTKPVSGNYFWCPPIGENGKIKL